MSIYAPVGDIDWAPLMFFDVHVSETWREIAVVVSLVQEHRIGFVVELGVDRGGLGLFLAMGALLRDGFGYLGLELRGENIPSQVLSGMAKFGGRVELIQKDVLTAECVQYVALAMSNRARPALIFCDNGNKPKEVALYAPICRVGDWLLVHDWTIEINEPDVAQLPAMGFERVGLYGRVLAFRRTRIPE